MSPVSTPGRRYHTGGHAQVSLYLRSVVFDDDLAAVGDDGVWGICGVLGLPEGARLLAGFPATKGVAQHLALQIYLMRAAEAVAEEEAVGGNGAWRAHLARGFGYERDENGW